jgi:uncharacterized protein (DUF433 family)
MASVAELESQISKLSENEKHVLLKRLADQVGTGSPGVVKTSGVAGGEACIRHTRIPVWLLEQFRRDGWTEAQILENYPTLRAIDLVNAWNYTGVHTDEIDAAIQANMAD